jgi:hypothetical protein
MMMTFCMRTAAHLIAKGDEAINHIMRTAVQAAMSISPDLMDGCSSDYWDCLNGSEETTRHKS